MAARLLSFLFLLRECAATFLALINDQSVACEYTQNSNGYGSNTWTTTSPDSWVANSYSGKYPTNYDLRYERGSTTTATGGRCETAMFPTVSGDGVFTTTIYIHTTVSTGTGVFTIALLPEPFDIGHELDLIVVNVDQDTMKSGQPGNADSYTLSEYSDKWIDITLVKTGDKCKTAVQATSFSNTTLEQESLDAMWSASVDCALHGSNKLVINSRGRDGGDPDGPSFVSVLSVSWKQADIMLAYPNKTAAVLAAKDDCCLEGRCCSGMEYCCDECDGSCRCSVHGKCS